MNKSRRRTYDQFCGLARALDVVGERWTVLLVRDLALGPQRYSDLLTGEPGIGTSMLAERLRHLEDEGLVRRAHLPPPAAGPAYALTDEGRRLVDALMPLALWGAERLGERDREARHRPEWMFVALRARFRPERAAGVHETYEFRLDGTVLHARVDDGAIDVRRGPADRPDLVVTAGAPTLLDLSLGRITAAEAVASGRAEITGSAAASAHCLAIFSA